MATISDLPKIKATFYHLPTDSGSSWDQAQAANVLDALKSSPNLKDAFEFLSVVTDQASGKRARLAEPQNASVPLSKESGQDLMSNSDVAFLLIPNQFLANQNAVSLREKLNEFHKPGSILFLLSALPMPINFFLCPGLRMAEWVQYTKSGADITFKLSGAHSPGATPLSWIKTCQDLLSRWEVNDTMVTATQKLESYSSSVSVNASLAGRLSYPFSSSTSLPYRKIYLGFRCPDDQSKSVKQALEQEGKKLSSITLNVLDLKNSDDLQKLPGFKDDDIKSDQFVIKTIRSDEIKTTPSANNMYVVVILDSKSQPSDWNQRLQDCRNKYRCMFSIISDTESGNINLWHTILLTAINRHRTFNYVSMHASSGLTEVQDALRDTARALQKANVTQEEMITTLAEAL